MTHHQRTWIIPPPPDHDRLLRFPDVPRLIQILLWQRGVQTPEEFTAFVRPNYASLGDPMAFRQMRPAIDIILGALKSHAQVTVYGDYDADGVTGTALLVEALQQYGLKVNWYLPERLSEGYGLNRPAVEKLAAAGTKLLITVDCGTSNLAEVRRAKELGLEVIILDHHHQPAEMPPADAIINPTFADEHYPCRTLSSAGVAFTLVRGLNLVSQNGAAVGRPLAPGWEKWLLDLVAISTVADMMPLRDENRTLVHFGLLVLRKTRRPGLRALFTVIGSSMERADEYTIGFLLAPRINAAGRLQHASIALALLLEHDPNQARRLAEQLQAVNLDRQRLTELAMAEALEQIATQPAAPALTMFAPHWSPGILGLVAGRLSDRLWRPVLVMAENDGQVVGSGRSVPGFNIMDVMDDGRQHFLRFGGHPGACGFTLAARDQRSRFEEWFRQRVAEAWRPEHTARVLRIDGQALIDDVSTEVLDYLEALGPYGIDHPRPTFMIDRVRVDEAMTVGNDGQHLRLTINDGQRRVRCIGFRMADRQLECRPGSEIDIVLEPSWNVWQGRRDPQLKIIDLRSHQ